MIEVRISERAKFQLKESAKFYESRQSGLGKKFTKSVRKKIHFAVKNPLAAEIKYDNVHVTYLKIFPFSIHYLYDTDQSVVFVSAIFHTSQNQEKL